MLARSARSRVALSLGALGSRTATSVHESPVSGVLVLVSDDNAVPLAAALPPAEQRLLFGGLPMPTDDPDLTLWDLGVRTDDHLCLSFDSPVMPDKLRLVRTPAPPKAPKGDKKGGKGKGKKKK